MKVHYQLFQKMGVGGAFQKETPKNKDEKKRNRHKYEDNLVHIFRDEGCKDTD